MEALRIANCSGFYGDRRTAAREMVEGGGIDVLTGDYLAELTMAVLWRTRARDPERGYAAGFVDQMAEVLATCVDRGIRIVANAGGLDPAGLARRLDRLAHELGVEAVIGCVDGDDLMDRIPDLAEAGHRLPHLATGEPMAGAPLTANAYLGGWGIARALELGADVVVTGRVADAALVVGPAAWRFGWAHDAWDELAGAVVAGHAIECGTQVTGGNYSFFQEVPGLEHPGFPLVEMHPDGSFVVTKHPGTGGMVSVGTVTAQLLYEIEGARYPSPDVTARFDSIRLVADGPDRVRVHGVVGEPPPPHLKVAVNLDGGHRNQVTFVVTGLDVEEKARVVEQALWKAVGGRERFAASDVRMLRWDRPDPESHEQAMAHLQITVDDPDERRVGRAFSRAAVELALASYPGLFATAPPSGASPLVVFWPARVPVEQVPQRVTVGDVVEWLPSPVHGGGTPPPVAGSEPPHGVPAPSGPTRRVPLGRVFGARSGDKGGDANVGVWARDAAGYRWLADELTEERFRSLIPEARPLPVERHLLPNLRAVNFVVRGLLGTGASSSLRPDPQAKSLGEHLRARIVDLPSELVDRAG